MKSYNQFLKTAKTALKEDTIVVQASPVSSGTVAAETVESDITTGLQALLCDHWKFYIKAYNFHWNVVGPRFITLHAFFQQIFSAEPANIDLIAERIRQLGGTVKASAAQFASCGQICECGDDCHLDENGMINAMLEDVKCIINCTREMINKIGEGDDYATADMLIKHLDEYEKLAWLIRSNLSL